MIHGSNASIGCLAMGDAAAEELFVLAADTGLARMTVYLCPCELRTELPDVAHSTLPPWTAGLYAQLAKAVRALPAPE
jgi:hypothetical protein